MPQVPPANNRCEGTIDAAKLTKRQQSVGFAEPARIDATELGPEEA